MLVSNSLISTFIEIVLELTKIIYCFKVADSTYLRTAGSKALASLLEGEGDGPLDTLDSIYKLYKKKVNFSIYMRG